MDKYIYDDKNGLWYELQGDYYIPCLILPTEKEQPIGLWGTAAFALSERISQAYIYQFAHKRKAERIPCRDRQTGKGYVPSVDKTDVGA